jgi:hypothetical protein
MGGGKIYCRKGKKEKKEENTAFWVDNIFSDFLQLNQSPSQACGRS